MIEPHTQHPSYVDVSQPKASGSGNPLDDLKALVTEQKIQADYLVCGGDLGDKATPIAIEHAWREINEIKKLLGAKEILATVGNHDVDSRYKHNDHDAKGLLLELSPGFPFSDITQNNQFWTHHFLTFDDPATNVRFVIINSSAYHGEGNNEYERGRVSDRTRRRLIAGLRNQGPRSANVLVCHHHPQKHSELKRGDYDDMRGGYDLLSALNAAEFGPWLVIHGHKHHPKLTYGPGGAGAPLIFSAGACGVILDSDIALHARNQVYRVAVEIDGPMKSTPRGTYLSWDWAPGVGWNRSRVGSGLPSRGGFGFRGDLPALAKDFADKFPEGGRWTAIQQSIRDLAYLLPEELGQLRLLLTRDHDYTFEEGTDGVPILAEK